MTLLNIIKVPDPVLKTTAHEVDVVDDTIRTQIDNMLETMYNAPGIGLAANQVNILNRVLVMDLSDRRDNGQSADLDKNISQDKTGPICMVNPKVIWESEDMSVMEEGCLSIPRQYAEVERPAIVRVSYLDYNGKPAELEAEGLLSHCVQHEIDHLNGVLFVDYLSNLKRKMMLRKVEKMSKQGLI